MGNNITKLAVEGWFTAKVGDRFVQRFVADDQHDGWGFTTTPRIERAADVHASERERIASIWPLVTFERQQQRKAA